MRRTEGWLIIQVHTQRERERDKHSQSERAHVRSKDTIVSMVHEEKELMGVCLE